jgi:hypothetical protein
MSSGYRALSRIEFTDLNASRLAGYGIAVDVVDEKARRLIADGHVLWAYSGDHGLYFARYAGNMPWDILDALEVEFGTTIVNNHDYRYWGFETKVEMEARLVELEAETRVERLTSSGDKLASSSVAEVLAAIRGRKPPAADLAGRAVAKTTRLSKRGE